MQETYSIRLGEGEWREVSKEEFVKYERQAGFYNTLGQPNEPATGGFSGRQIEGRISYSK